METSTINLKINYKSTSNSLSLPISTLLSSLRDSITDFTQVDPSNQKLLPTPKPKSDLWNKLTTSTLKGKKIDHDPSLQELGLKDGMKILVLGPQNQDLQKLDQLQKENEKRNTPRSLHPSLLRGTKVSIGRS